MNDKLTNRKFSILDVMVLVMVIAISLGLTRSVLSFRQGPPLPRAVYAVVASAWVVQFTMLALIPLRLLYPHVPVSRLWRQPGWLACNAVAFALILTIARLFLAVASNRARDPSFPISMTYFQTIMDAITWQMPGEAFIAVAVSWGTLALVGGRESENGWIERVARLGGLYFLIFPFLSFIVAWSGIF